MRTLSILIVVTLTLSAVQMSQATSNHTTASKHRRLWSGALQFSPEYDSPSGDYYYATTNGVGFGFSFYVALSRPLLIRLDLAKTGLSDKGLRQILVSDTEYAVARTDFDLNAYRIALMLQYAAAPPRIHSGATFWHMNFGFGAIKHRVASHAVLKHKHADLYININLSDAESKGLFTCGFGATTIVVGRFGLDYSGQFDFVFGGSNAGDSPMTPYTDPGTAVIYSLRLGIIAFY